MLFVTAMTAAVLGRLAPDLPVDDPLVRRLKAGDSQALGDAYDAHHEAVRAFARRLLGDGDAAEDLVHDVFVALPGAARRFEGRSTLRTFILSVAVNHARHARRSWARRIGAYERLHLEPRDPGGDPEKESERRALAAMLERMLLRLPMDQRLVVVLCIVEERTSGEAAEIAGVPEATIRTRLFYARRKLREMLDAEVAR
jgi:RNA polymerase sigma-70 factor (ECF subfamily)